MAEETPIEIPAKEAPATPAGDKRPVIGFILSLIGGIIILVQGIIMAFVGAVLGAIATALGRSGAGLMLMAMLILAPIFGVLVIVGAVLLYVKPGKEKTGGILAILFSAAALFLGGGWFIGSILGIVGGVLGITKK